LASKKEAQKVKGESGHDVRTYHAKGETFHFARRRKKGREQDLPKRGRNPQSGDVWAKSRGIKILQNGKTPKGGWRIQVCPTKGTGRVNLVYAK